MKNKIIVYRVDAQFVSVSNEGKGFSYSFYFMTPEPIDTQFGRVINLICNEQRVSFDELSTSYFDVNVVRVSEFSN
jgi:hypothetical protein